MLVGWPVGCKCIALLYNVGSVDCAKAYEPKLWLTAMVRESESAQPFYSEGFKAWADDILRQDMNISQDNITAACCREVYLHIINEDPRD